MKTKTEIITEIITEVSESYTLETMAVDQAWNYGLGAEDLHNEARQQGLAGLDGLLVPEVSHG